jgi:hypothetical protein
MIPTVTTTYMALTGSELLAQVKILGEVSEPELAAATGYVTAEGKPKIAALRSGLLEAYGLKVVKAPKSGRALSYEGTIQKNGNAILSGGYTSQLGLAPGDKFAVEVDAEEGIVEISKL